MNIHKSQLSCCEMRKHAETIYGFWFVICWGWTSKEFNAWIFRRVLDWNRWNHCPYAPCMVYLPLFYLHFGWFLVHMLVNIPYMEHLGWDFKLQNQSTYPLQRTDVVTWSVETDKRKTCYDVRFPAKHEPIISQLIVKTYPLVNIQKTMEHHHF